MIGAQFLIVMRREVAGNTVVEFAMIAPVLVGFLLGIFDIGSNLYTATQLEGAIQKAARDSTIEGAAGRSAAIDANVSAAVHEIASGATVTFSRTAYTNYESISRPEDFNDIDENGVCDNGEPFEDSNRNGQWDLDRGAEGSGGARDAVLYKVNVTYTRIFPVASLLGLSDKHNVEAITVLRNQPYGTQTSPSVGSCV
ncbi:TadE family protein [Altererythrobacter sp. ZODW24]|uniref:TadE/TadG family type IV pilus assembly protein n=1 Tax=Altererythrobacter sp. ZODW24 TaxID=2185142 RepID=UPI0013B426EB|nr:TadE family protein [Altererythrobacter sp. ZODW24]